MIGANDAGPSTDRWIVWDQKSRTGPTAHIALCEINGKCRWSHVWPDAYEPTIQYMGRWSTDKANVFLVTFNEGAEAETAVAIGWSPGKSPIIYDHRDGAWIALAPDNVTMEINTSSGTDLTLACFGWDKTTMRFEDASCSWLPANSSSR